MATSSKNNLQERLDALEHMPGELPFVKEAAWEKLYPRLGERPPRRTAKWYPAVAALLLLAFLPLLLNKRSTTIINNPVAHHTMPPPATHLKALVTGRSGTVPSKLPVQRTAGIARKTAGSATRKKIYAAGIIQPSMVIANGGFTAVEAPVIKTPDTSVQLAVVSSRKKLPVVHINELGKQEQENARFAAHSQHNFFRLKLSDSQPGGALPAATGQELLKTTIPLKN